MDSLTHIVLGACIGEAVAGKQLGKKAMLLGAVAQSIPDIDAIGSIWLNEVDDIVAHRSLTHSIVFAIVVSCLLAWIAGKMFHRHNAAKRTYVLLFSVNIFVHVFIDAFNAYGTELFYPFNDTRFSFNLVFVADPLFSIGPLIAFVWLLLAKSKYVHRKKIAVYAIALTTIYITYAFANKMKVEQVVANTLNRQHIVSEGHFTTPTILNSLLWYVVVKQEDGYKVGYRSVFDKTGEIVFNDVERNDSLLNNVTDKNDALKLIRFSSGYYTVEKWSDTLVLNVLRFGQIGWQDPAAKFTFHYLLNKPEGNQLVIQRGRFKNMNRERVSSFIRRVKGI
ncbi:metal-dependent hydrolase [Terrimonas sp.]|uniref:metal-dependent hydrolase n=1 Tax=Terrimonas sp. TaxID=1914338 RepID=UPI0014022B01|nr:metal-dependent hydrolase [Terrimonas sp.]